MNRSDRFGIEAIAPIVYEASHRAPIPASDGAALSFLSAGCPKVKTGIPWQAHGIFDNRFAWSDYE